MSRKTELALTAIQKLFGRSAPLKGAELASLLQTTPHYLPHVMRPLVRSGWVASDRGPTGGYSLQVDPSDVTLFDVIEAVEGPIEESRCVLRGKPCPPTDLCALHEPWLQAREALFAELRRTTLAEIQVPQEAA